MSGVSSQELELAKEAIRLTFAHALEEEQAPACFNMFADGTVAPDILHVTLLPLSVIVEDIFSVLFFPVVMVAMLGSRLASEEHYER